MDLPQRSLEGNRLHTHTPASKDTDAWRRAVGTAEELTAEQWLLKYMSAGIDRVAVTHHNSGHGSTS